MIIALFGNAALRTLFAQAIQRKAEDLNFKIKKIADLKNYRPNRQMFGEPDFDNWVLTDSTIESLEQLEKFKPLLVSIELVGQQDAPKNIPYKYRLLGSSYTETMDNLAMHVLTSEKLVYPSEIKAVDYGKQENQIGCGYCVNEHGCKLKKPGVNMAKQGCQFFIHFSKAH